VNRISRRPTRRWPRHGTHGPSTRNLQRDQELERLGAEIAASERELLRLEVEARKAAVEAELAALGDA
jgi:hypothetical protein